MDSKAINERMEEFFNNVDPDDLLNEVVSLGYEVEDIKETLQSNDE